MTDNIKIEKQNIFDAYANTDGRLAFFRLVRAMREAQREYFRSRSHDALTKARALEKRVDDCITKGDEYLNKQQNIQQDLFT